MADADKNLLTKLLREMGHGDFPLTPKLCDGFLNILARHLLIRRKWNSKGPTLRHCGLFFRISRHNAQRILNKGKRVNAEFYEGIMNRLLYPIIFVHYYQFNNALLFQFFCFILLFIYECFVVH